MVIPGVKSVAVIGAGPSGAIALDSLLKERVFDKIRVFERRGEAGGCWIYNNSSPDPLPQDLSLLARREADIVSEGDIPSWKDLPTRFPKRPLKFHDTATYPTLHTNVDSSTMEYSNEPFPQTRSAASIKKHGNDTPFRHHTVVKGWIQDIFKKNNEENLVSYNTCVELIEKNEETDQWDIMLRKILDNESQDYLWKESFDAVIVATGRYDVPFIPYIEGLQEFFDTPGKKVIHTKAFRSGDSFENEKVIVVGGAVSAGDAIQDLVPFAKLPLISSIRHTSSEHVYFGNHAFEHKDIERHTDIVKIEGSTVYFQDGSSVLDVDSIIFGTGFSISFPFLPKLAKTDLRLKGIYQHIFQIEDPTLCFIGNIGAGLTFKAFEWQAVVVARFLAGRCTLPSVEEQYDWERHRVEIKGETPKYSQLVPEFREYFENLRLLAGNKGPGRKLPEFNDEWVDAFWAGHQLRINHWIANNGYN